MTRPTKCNAIPSFKSPFGVLCKCINMMCRQASADIVTHLAFKFVAFKDKCSPCMIVQRVANLHSSGRYAAFPQVRLIARLPISECRTCAFCRTIFSRICRDTFSLVILVTPSTQKRAASNVALITEQPFGNRIKPVAASADAVRLHGETNKFGAAISAGVRPRLVTAINTMFARTRPRAILSSLIIRKVWGVTGYTDFF